MRLDESEENRFEETKTQRQLRVCDMFGGTTRRRVSLALGLAAIVGAAVVVVGSQREDATLSAGRSVCEFAGWTVAKEALFYYQRVEAADALECVERCIDSSDYCRATVFLVVKHPDDEKKRNYCQFYSSNSEEARRPIRARPTPLQIRAGERAAMPLDSTLFELLERCPPDASGLADGLSGASRRKLRAIPSRKHDAEDEPPKEELVQISVAPSTDASLHKRLRDSLRDSYASANINPNEYMASRAGPHDANVNDIAGLVPIRPVSVSHGGLGASNDAHVGTVAHGHSAGGGGAIDGEEPCSAQKSGDPCAPRRPPARWSEWTPDGPCSVQCGRGVRPLRRYCSLARECSGESQKEEPCEMPACNQWAGWSEWSRCSVTCGPDGQIMRERRCRFGTECVGASVDVRPCNAVACPRWAAWGAWSAGCSTACGPGFRERERECQPRGQHCEGGGGATERQPCETRPCPSWAAWAAWEPCSASCGGGEMVRRRECQNEIRSGEGCHGAAEERRHCNAHGCPVWSEWTPWSGCSQTCGDGATRFRTRQCSYQGRPSQECEGTAEDRQPCRLPACPQWTAWGEWGSCSMTCGQGQQLRYRRCDAGSRQCVGGDREMRFCHLASCPYFEAWTEWGGCSVTCGRGHCERTRRCRRGEPFPLAVGSDDGYAAGAASSSRRPGGHETRAYANRSAAGAEAHSVKNSAVHETEEEPHGQPHARHLEVAQSKSVDETANERPLLLRDAHVAGGLQGYRTGSSDAIGCVGPTVDRKSCDAGPCCNWTPWNGWGDCTAQCGTGSRIRSRRCELEPGHGLLGRPNFDMPKLSYNPSVFGQQYAFGQQSALGLNKHLYAGTYASPFQIGVPRASPAHSSSPFNGVCDCEGAPTESVACAAPAHLADACKPAGKPHAAYDDRHPSVSEPSRKRDAPSGCEWAAWTAWTPCRGTCRRANRSRRRSCARPYGDDSEYEPCDCRPGADAQTEPCTPEDCPTSDGLLPAHEADSARIIGDEDSPSDSNTRAYTDERGATCGWSEWSDWSICGADALLRRRNRVCDGESSSCDCDGAADEEETCRGGKRGVSEVKRLKIVPKSSDADEYERRLRDAMRPTSRVIRPESVEDERCEWTRWSEWSTCAVPSGSDRCEAGGERQRMRSCGCSGGCAGGITQESESCVPSDCARQKRGAKNFVK